MWRPTHDRFIIQDQEWYLKLPADLKYESLIKTPKKAQTVLLRGAELGEAREWFERQWRFCLESDEYITANMEEYQLTGVAQQFTTETNQVEYKVVRLGDELQRESFVKEPKEPPHPFPN